MRLWTIMGLIIENFTTRPRKSILRSINESRSKACPPMDEEVDQIFDCADWDALTPRLLHYADYLICRIRWRGAYLISGSNFSPCGDSFSAEDALNQAVDSFLDRRRSYQRSVSLEQNLKGAIMSIVSNWNKSSARKPLVEINPQNSNDTHYTKACEEITDPDDSALQKTLRSERSAYQAVALDAFRASLGDDRELLTLLEAYTKEFYKPRDIEIHTGIPTERVFELKRKLRLRMSRFISKYPNMAAIFNRISHAKPAI